MSKDAKVCPSCGCEPWNFAEGDNPKIEGSSKDSSEPRRQPNFCDNCGEKLIAKSELPKDVWKDPSVKEALKDGRPASDIWLLPCPECHNLGYYNEGSSFSCRFGCGSWRVTEEQAEEAITLVDSVTDCTEGYDNQTRTL